MEGGCTWQTTTCDQIATIIETTGVHISKCTFNPPVQHRRRQEELAEARLVAEEEATKARQVAAKERGKERDYRRQREDQEAEAQDETCNCPWANWCTCGN